MSAVARTLGVSRSSLIEHASKSPKPRGPYRKADDIVLLAELRPIIDQRPKHLHRPERLHDFLDQSNLFGR